MLYSLFRPALFLVDAETAHGLSLAALRLLPSRPAFRNPILQQRVAGLDFPNPVGLAPGYDKNGDVFHAAYGLGFGYVEVGSVTPKPQSGNPRPRVFRLVEDNAVINRMGFNNDGMEAVAARLQACPAGQRSGPLGINVGANKDSQDRTADYVIATKRLADLADYVTVNISSPNTPGLRALQDKAALDDLLARVTEAVPVGKPVFLKVAPDLEPADIDDIAASVIEHKIDARIVSNTTITRPAMLSLHADETGGPCDDHGHGSGPPDGGVAETPAAHLLGLVDIAQVHDDRLKRQQLDPVQIQRPELVPLGQDHERVGHPGGERGEERQKILLSPW